jgi:DNA polymerase III subunit delta
MLPLRHRMAIKIHHALEYLFQTKHDSLPPVCAVFGNEPFLRRQVMYVVREAVLGKDDGDFSLTTLEGDKAEWRSVVEELETTAMFSNGKRLVQVDDADAFVTHYRDKIEDYIARPSRTGVLVLEIDVLKANTRLYKLLAPQGGLIDCSVPTDARLLKWLSQWADRRHNVQLSPAAAELLIELIGPELGLLDQELAKLALLIGSGKKILPELVSQSVGAWRAKTAWVMLDIALDGKPAEALQQLDRLLASGEQPIGVLAQISSSLRRLAAATRMIFQAEAEGRRLAVSSALTQAGVKPFALNKVEQQLRRLTRLRGAKLYPWLLEADLDLKGDSNLPPQLILERLILRLASPINS